MRLESRKHLEDMRQAAEKELPILIGDVMTLLNE